MTTAGSIYTADEPPDRAIGTFTRKFRNGIASGNFLNKFRNVMKRTVYEEFIFSFWIKHPRLFLVNFFKNYDRN